MFDYFRASMKIEDISSLIADVGNKETPVYIPAKLCKVVAGQASRAKLNGRQMEAMIGFAVRAPYLNAMSIVRDGPQTMGLTAPLNTKLVRAPGHTHD